MNLLKETIDFLAEHEKVPGDVHWVGIEDGKQSVTWDEFARLADREYDEGYGLAEVRCDLVVVGEDWWLERNEYDGAEWWEFKTLPRIAVGIGGRLDGVFVYGENARQS